MKQKFLAAGSGDTIRSRPLTGKPARMLRRAWIDEWERDGPPPPLAMPLQRALAAEARVRIARPSHQEGTGPDRGVPVGWPWTFGRFRDEMRAPDLSAYTVTPAGLAPERSMA